VDTAFGSSGIVQTTAASSVSQAKALQIGSDGKILVLGSASNGNGQDTLLVRYNSDGTQDSTFHSGGIVFLNFGSFDQGEGLAITADGHILNDGVGGPASPENSFFARLTSNGVLDTSFGSQGLAPNFGASFFAGLALLSNGTIVTVGAVNSNALIARYTAAGQLDTTFNGTGSATATFTGPTGS
jgi:uncharacterized delta-60 repeat protein